MLPIDMRDLDNGFFAVSEDDPEDCPS